MDEEGIVKAYLQTLELRFDKLDEKLDELAKVVVSLAKAETQLIGLQESRREQGRRIGALEDNFHELKAETEDNTEFRKNLVKAGWVVVTAVVTAGSAYFIL